MSLGNDVVGRLGEKVKFPITNILLQFTDARLVANTQFVDVEFGACTVTTTLFPESATDTVGTKVPNASKESEAAKALNAVAVPELFAILADHVWQPPLAPARARMVTSILPRKFVGTVKTVVLVAVVLAVVMV